MKAWINYLGWHLVITFLPYARWKNAALNEPNGQPCEGSQQYMLVKSIVSAAERAARHHIVPINCLRRCLVTKRLLCDQGIYPRIQYGVKKMDTELHAHCWLTLNGIVINDTSDNVNTYHELQHPDEFFFSNMR